MTMDYHDRIKQDQQSRSRSLSSETFDRLKRNRLAMLGFFVLVIMAILAVFADVIAPYGYDQQDVYIKFLSPCRQHLFGTDYLGRDVLSRIIYGARYSLAVGFAATAMGALIGVIIGSLAGYFGGVADDIIMRILDIIQAIPSLLLAIVVCATLGNGLFNCMLAVAISTVPKFARTVRGPILDVKEKEYIEAAKSIDASNFRIIFKHVLLNILSPLIVEISLSVASAIRVSASLSFIGLGVTAPNPEWGAMISNAKTYLRQYPYLMIYPTCALGITVIGLNLFGDGLRDALDPRLKK